jgi:hypothetical protein
MLHCRYGKVDVYLQNGAPPMTRHAMTTTILKCHDQQSPYFFVQLYFAGGLRFRCPD